MTRREQMVHEALRLLERDGFEGLSMRALADRLRIRAPSLYKHVRDKQELLEWMAERLCAEVPAPDARKPWQAELRRMAMAQRRVLLSHRDGARVLAETAPAGEHRLRLIDRVLGTFLAAGFSSTAAVDAASALNSYVVGFVLDEAAERASSSGDPFARLAASEYPHLVALRPVLRKAPAPRRFRTGLEALLAGLELRRGRRPLRRP